MESFPASLKCAMLEQYAQKIGSFDKENYRPASILPLLLKVY